MEIEYSLDKINEVAHKILTENTHKILLFQGEMGAGKTTLIKALCKVLTVHDAISSPTFSLVNEYETEAGEILYHFDFYRIKNQQEALDMGAEDYFYSGNYCFIEWAEKIPDLIPNNHSIIKIESIDSNTRKLTLE